MKTFLCPWVELKIIISDHSYDQISIHDVQSVLERSWPRIFFFAILLTYISCICTNALLIFIHLCQQYY